MIRGQRSKLACNLLLSILIVFAASEFVVRGPVRFLHAASFNDFISPYVQTRAWMKGDDPYSSQNLVRLWPPEAERFDFLSRDLADGTLVLKRGIPTAYPLTAFLLIAPVAALPWNVAHPLWLAITLLSFTLTIASLLSIAKLLPWTKATVVFVALALALAPFHTAFAAGSIVLLAVTASAAAVWAATSHRDLFAGVLLAVAIGLKPQIGLPFCFYYLVSRRWRIGSIACGIVAVLFVLAWARLSSNGTSWFQSYLYDNQILFAPGSLGDFAEGNSMRFGLINLQVAAYTLLHSRDWANLTAMVVAGTAGLTWLWLLLKKRSNNLLALSALVVISLLPLYHRFYDATLLIFPLAWSMTALRGRLHRSATAVLLLLVLVFFFPAGSALEYLQATGHFAAMQHYWWWNTIVLPHESWSILLLSLVLMHAMQTSSLSPEIYSADTSS